MGDLPVYVEPNLPLWLKKLLYKELVMMPVKSVEDINNPSRIQDATDAQIMWDPKWRWWKDELRTYWHRTRVWAGSKVVGKNIWESMADPCPKCGVLHYFFRRKEDE